MVDQTLAEFTMTASVVIKLKLKLKIPKQSVCAFILPGVKSY